MITLEHGTRLKRICQILYDFFFIFHMTERESMTGLLLLFLRLLWIVLIMCIFYKIRLAFGQFGDELPVFFLDPYFIPASPLIQVLWRLVWWSNITFDYNFHQMNQSTMFCFCFYLAPLMRDTLWKWQYEFKIIPVNLILSLELSWIELSPEA
jgi:hypothetical protein